MMWWTFAMIGLCICGAVIFWCLCRTAARADEIEPKPPTGPRLPHHRAKVVPLRSDDELARLDTVTRAARGEAFWTKFYDD